jgi:hypothetical protein
MASVEMGAEGSYRFKGDHITQIAYCLYCDTCGSFRIGKRPTLKMLIGISVAAITATIIWNSMKEGALPGAWLACFGPLFIVYISELDRCSQTRRYMPEVWKHGHNPGQRQELPQK